MTAASPDPPVDPLVRAGGAALRLRYDPWRLATHSYEDLDLATQWMDEALRQQQEYDTRRDHALIDDLIGRLAEAQQPRD